MNIRLPDRIIMIDGEFSGLNPKKDDLLQFAMLKAVFDKESFQYLVSRNTLNIFIHSGAQPTKTFHREHLAECFKQANASKTDLVQAKKLVDEYVGDWWGTAWPCGDCVTTDLAFAYEKGLFVNNTYDENDVEQKGTLDYRIFEMKPLKVLAQTFGWEKPQDVLREHDALNDCFNQMVELNHCLAFFKQNLSEL
jgi:oligoribonuclease (3'-5' exoribonuclease)